MMNHVSSDMISKITSVDLATKSPCWVSAPRPNGFSTVVSDMDRFPLLRQVLVTSKHFRPAAERYLLVSFQAMGKATVFSTGLPSSVAGNIFNPWTAFKQASSRRGKPLLV